MVTDRVICLESTCVCLFSVLFAPSRSSSLSLPWPGVICVGLTDTRGTAHAVKGACVSVCMLDCETGQNISGSHSLQE